MVYNLLSLKRKLCILLFKIGRISKLSVEYYNMKGIRINGSI